jgi:hypothetical protein
VNEATPVDEYKGRQASNLIWNKEVSRQAAAELKVGPRCPNDEQHVVYKSKGRSLHKFREPSFAEVH